MVALLIMISATLFGQIPNHRFPRTVFFHFGNACTDYYARFDMVIKSSRSSDWVIKLKEQNPDVIVLSTSGWTSCGPNDTWFPDGSYDNYVALDSEGNPVSTGGQGRLADITELCPLYNGKKLNEALPEKLVDITPLSVYDGIATDWLWTQPWNVTDIDLDRNGVNDYSEHGKTWVNDMYNEGVETLLSNLRSALPEDKLILCNSGGWHKYGQSTTNGVSFEHLSFFTSPAWHWQMYQFVSENFQAPMIHTLLCHNSKDDPETPDPSKEYYKNMRFLLTFTLLEDGYFSYMDAEAGEYTYNYWYDEYELQLGYPKGPPQQLSNGCLARVYDRGISICNITGTDQTITVSDISGLDGYSGPYYRFYGGQDPTFNDGSLFDQVVLWGSTEWLSKTRGDGIILMAQPDTVVSDIIVDNIVPATSPGSDRAVFSGPWTRSIDHNQAYYVSVRSSVQHYALSYAYSGDGSSVATFTPTITRPGQYEIFEWHGEVPDLASATNVPHIITAREGETTINVDQTQNLGQWNSLGVYTLDAGTDDMVEITNNANGTVIADAIKFVFQHVAPDLEAPATMRQPNRQG